MITEIKSNVDKLWTDFWQGGITNPLTVIEQISFLMFARMLDIRETRAEKMARHSGTEFKRLFSPEQQDIRWQNFRHLDAEALLPLVREKVFPFFKTVILNGDHITEYMKDAQLMIQRPELLKRAVNAIDKLPLNERDTKGDLYEYLLSKLTTAGINGQFRTPRHIIALMVNLVDPKPTDYVADPACGTAGFLVGTLEHLQRTHTSPEGILEEKDEYGTTTTIYTGDLLAPYRDHIEREMFHGWDFDVTMLRIATMNMLLHGAEAPHIHYHDTLSNTFVPAFPHLAEEAFDIVLANPPFKGALDESSVDKALTSKVKTSKTELLFILRFLRMLRLGGRCACIVPAGVLFGASTVHIATRKLLIEENQLEAVISLPSGVFKPYAGVSTAILVFTKSNSGGTDHVWFYDVQADGWSLDDKRTPLLPRDKLGPVPQKPLSEGEHQTNNLPDVLARWTERKRGEHQRPRTAQSFCVPKSEIAAQEYDLSINRYNDREHVAINHRPPKEILSELLKMEEDIINGVKELEGMLG